MHRKIYNLQRSFKKLTKVRVIEMIFKALRLSVQSSVVRATRTKRTSSRVNAYYAVRGAAAHI